MTREDLLNQCLYNILHTRQKGIRGLLEARDLLLEALRAPNLTLSEAPEDDSEKIFLSDNLYGAVEAIHNCYKTYLDQSLTYLNQEILPFEDNEDITTTWD